MATDQLSNHWAICDKAGDVLYDAEADRAQIYGTRRLARERMGEIEGCSGARPLHIEKVTIHSITEAPDGSR